MNRRDLLTTLGAAGIFAGSTHRRPAPAFGPRGPADRSKESEELRAKLAGAIGRHNVPGASAAVFRDGKLTTAAVGFANLSSGVELTTETVMHIGSITKVLNTTLLMQLVDDALVDLDQPVKRYLPDFRVSDPEATERITVKMLVNHTSGIDGELTQEAGHDQERIVDAIERIASMGQIHAPGADLSYCNAATVVAGYLSQQLRKKSWYDLVKERIFATLDMQHSIAVPEDALLHRASVGHFPNPKGGKPVRTTFVFLPLSFAPAGATCMLSAADLVAFARAHMEDGAGPGGRRLLSAASAQAMRTKTASFRGVGFGDVGLGWMLLENGVVTHGGGGPGIVSGLYAHPPTRTAVAVLTNGANGSPVINEIVSPILEATAGIAPLGSAVRNLVKNATDAPVEATPYAGRYESVTTVLEVVPQGRGIAVRSRLRFKYYDSSSTADSPAIPLRPIGEGRFAMGESVVAFVNPRPDGKMAHLASGGRLLKRVS